MNRARAGTEQDKFARELRVRKDTYFIGCFEMKIKEKAYFEGF